MSDRAPGRNETTLKVAKTILLLLIGLLVLQALAYGVGFVADPEGNVSELGVEVPDPLDTLTVGLVRLLGLCMVGAAVLLALSAVLIWRGNQAGTYITIIIGGIYVGVALFAVFAESWWDVGFYGITGVALILLSGTVRWLGARPQSTAIGAT